MFYRIIACISFFVLFLFNIGFFFLKNFQVIESQKQRNHYKLGQFIKKNIPENSKVIGDPLFFYAVIGAGSDYQYFDLFSTLEERELNHRENYDYDYLIISEQTKLRNIGIANYYLKKAEFDTVATLNLPQTELSQSINNSGLVSEMEKNGYSCVILKRLK
ncbi:hypothetical protein [Flexithrix dorotheae]|uniref:hypothetical protein n=1 Tax=Flexithrix dorotheae TaxID=70993 RepID=UPI0003A23430|nr:hypothetical protein [Flexithrix dorotheae]